MIIGIGKTILSKDMRMASPKRWEGSSIICGLLCESSSSRMRLQLTGAQKSKTNN